MFELEWVFDEAKQNYMEELLQAEFENNGDYFKIKAVHYTYFDVLLGLEDLDFVLSKRGDHCILTVNFD